MNVWNGTRALPADLPAVAASIGKCDGVHLGHQEILTRVAIEARRSGAPAMLISFDPHPLAVLAPRRLPRLLQTRRQKLDCLGDTGLTDFLILRFDAEMAALDGESFFARILQPYLTFRSIFVGEDFRFGHQRSGDVALLRRIGKRAGFNVHPVPAVEIDGNVVSSSAIRQAVDEGRVEAARRMLGRPYSVVGEVVRGDGRGRELRFPTANLRVENEITPRPGVYISETIALAASHPSLTNVGVRPTFGRQELTVESHLLDFDEDLYSERIEVRFLARLRDEFRFRSAIDLADQIARDRAAAVAFFSNVQFGSS